MKIASEDEELEDIIIDSADEVAKYDLELETNQSGESEVELEGTKIDSKKEQEIDDVLDDSITENNGNPNSEEEPLVEKAD